MFDWNDRQVPSTSGKPWSVTTLGNATGPASQACECTAVKSSARPTGPRSSRGEQHEALRAMLGNPRVQQGRPATSLLGGLIRCGKCGAKMHASTRASGVRRYVCVVRPETNGCGKVAIQAERTEKVVVDVVMARLDTPELAGTVSVGSTPTSGLDGVEVLEDRLAQLADAFADGAITKPEWMRARGRIEKRLEDAPSTA